MPPVRAVNAKPMKTERTHEENQERAYIAASRRSDRSLEARIESARRASEIHKKRTGRSLRVTEQDVINEEMYEEEDDDLQSQYRRLQAHLGSSADLFSGRLNSWILSQYGTRQMVMGGGMPGGFNPAMNMQQPMTPFFAYNPQQPTSPNGTLSPQATQRNQNFRQSPYPGQQYLRMQGDQKSQSIPALQDQHIPQGMDANQTDAQTLNMSRRHSMAKSDSTSIPGTPLAQDNSMRPPMSRNGSTQPGTLAHPMFFNDQSQGQMSPQYQFNGYPNGMSSFDPTNQMQSPLTSNMPVESQQILGNNAFDPSNPYTNFFVGQTHGMPMTQGVGYTYNPNLSSTKMRQNSQSDGINQTLSPSPMTLLPSKLDTNIDNMSTPNLSANPISATTVDSHSSQFAQNMHFNNEGFGLGMDFSRSPGGGTPKNESYSYGEFSEWVDDEA